VRGVRSNAGRLLAASLYNGVVMQPQSGASNAVVAKRNAGMGGAQ
jgi:hypothetical protein